MSRRRWITSLLAVILFFSAGATGLVITTPDVDLALRTLRAAGATAYRAERTSSEEQAVVVADDGPPAPELIELLVRAGVAVHEARRSRTNLEELFARLTEEPA